MIEKFLVTTVFSLLQLSLLMDSTVLSMLCVLMKIISHDSVKKKTERLKGFKFHTVFKSHHGSEGVNAH